MVSSTVKVPIRPVMVTLPPASVNGVSKCRSTLPEPEENNINCSAELLARTWPVPYEVDGFPA